MRRCPLLLAPLLSALLLSVPLLPGGGAVLPPAAAQEAPAPTVVTLADSGRTVTLAPGGLLEVRLTGQGGAVWEGLETGGPTLHLLRYGSSEQEGLTAVLEALSPRREPQRLSAQTFPRCRATGPRCGLPSALWSLDVVVAEGPSVTGDLACTPTARPSASPFPGTVPVDASADGRTVRVRQDGLVVLTLDGCAEPAAAPPRAGAPLYRESVRVDRARGQVDALFRPLAAGTTTITAPYDARCLHRTDAAGDGECAVVQRVFSVTVEVLPVSTPTPSPCAKPVYEGFSVGPLRVAAGDPVVVQGGRRDHCVQEAQEPLRDFRLLAQPEGQPEHETYAVRARYFRYAEARPTRTTTYRLLMDGVPLRPTGEGSTVVVDRVSGSCRGAVALSGPSTAAPGVQVPLVGSAPPGAVVRVLFRRYGASASTLGRTLTAGADGRFRTSFALTDDHRWYAATDRCDSAAGLTRARPVVTGPASVRRGATVTLQVRAVAGVRTTVFFRGAGEPFSARRTLTGPGTVTYTATSDQRYYALTRDSASVPGLTQVLTRG